MSHAKHKKQTQNAISPETEQEALAIAKSTQKPGQTKEQTKLIAQGIEKGIAEYKKRQKAQKRQLDKKRKKVDQQLKRQSEKADATDNNSNADEVEIITSSVPKIVNRICYFLLAASLALNVYYQMNLS